MKQCDHCGRCCLSGVPCTFGAILFSITEKNPMRCPACEHKDKLYWCGLINNPLRWFPLLVGNIDWKCHAMSDIARIYIGIGDGCGMNPSKRELVSEIKARFKKNKAEMKRCKDCRKYKPCSVRASKQSLTLDTTPASLYCYTEKWYIKFMFWRTE